VVAELGDATLNAGCLDLTNRDEMVFLEIDADHEHVHLLLDPGHREEGMVGTLVADS